MSTTLLMSIALTLCMAGAARAELQCSMVKNTADKNDDFIFQGEKLPQLGKGYYKVFSTAEDKNIQSSCSETWTNPTDNWLYADDNFLWKGNPVGYTKKDALSAAAKTKQTTQSRYVCKDTDQKNATVGWFSVSYKDIVQTLQFLCTDPDARNEGWGLKMLNEAVAEGFGKFTESQTFKLVAHPKAVGFYNLLDLSCDYDNNKYEYTKIIQRINGGPSPIVKKYRCFKSINGGNTKIDYSNKCLNDHDYQSFLDINTHYPGTIVASCETYTGGESTFDSIVQEIERDYPH